MFIVAFKCFGNSIRGKSVWEPLSSLFQFGMVWRRDLVKD